MTVLDERVSVSPPDETALKRLSVALDRDRGVVRRPPVLPPVLPA